MLDKKDYNLYMKLILNPYRKKKVKNKSNVYTVIMYLGESPERTPTHEVLTQILYISSLLNQFINLVLN